MIPKYGLESVIFFDKKDETNRERSQEEMLEYCASKNIHLFKEVKVSLNLVEKNQRRHINVKLIEPFVEGFSVVLDCELDENINEQ